MSRRLAWHAAWVGAVVVAGAACGKRGAPLAPLRPVPARVTTATASLADGRVTLRLTVPEANLDGTTPAAIERIEVYRAPAAAGDPAVPAGQLVQPEHLRASIAIRRPGAAAESAAAPAPSVPPPAGASPVPGDPAPGDTLTWHEDLDAGVAGSTAEWRYVVLGVAGRNRRGPPSAVLAVPIGALPEAPADLRIGDYTETVLPLSWTPAGEGVGYHVFQSDASGALPRPLTTEPIAGGRFETPVEFGVTRCLVVRASRVEGGVTVLGPASQPVCETPVDRFPPPAPERLVATIDGDAVAIGWSPVEAADLAGYVVLRGEGAGETLQPLQAAPIVETTFRDTTAAAGVVYTYSVIAVDRASNRSAQSNRQTITRAPAGP